MERGQKCEVLKALEALKKASKEIEANPVGAAENGDSGCDSPSMKALLQLQSGFRDLLSGDPQLATLSDLLYRLRWLVSSFRSSSCRNGGGECGRGGGKGGIFGSIRWRRSSHSHKISRVAGSIGAEIQSWIDRESADRLVSAVRSFSPSVPREAEVEEGEALVRALESRVSQGFDRGLQDVLLRSGAFAAVESALADAAAPKRVRECAVAAVLALVRFNKAVFVGPVLMGPTLGALVSMSSASASAAALHALNGLIRAIRSPLVDELHARGHIPRLVGLLGITVAVEVRVLALDWALEIGYFGRKEAIDAMLTEGLIKRLTALQRSDLGDALIEINDGGGGGVPVGWLRRGSGGGDLQRQYLDARPFASCVALWAVQVEVGEGLRQREKREIKREVVARVKAAAATEAEAATVLAEVLWGSTIW
ncbi:hypothetical protein OPV22_014052 [Ensete ventricosum]|uniref:Interferon-related developmental regulator N-terminal domain-containing protein n=1 Tax=Ensete ventricosum TaxID=4639 RepID=A0AAV8RB31_ENSVE|nr:hypothetical protein OPV22_014052 [Ensete ventricosum]RWW38455.1 hypothetical protein BHE74_00056305 [Ensete ventricosum]RZR83870.1 hypothetical protein BHM03_00010580 [Ensete ventricosum]